MTDRDHFAAAALTGLLAGSEHTREVDALDHTETAYYIADAMLRERERTEQSPSGSGSGGTSGSAPERQSPASERGGGVPLDVTRPDNGEAAGGRGQNTQEPVAWAVFCGDSRYCYDHYDDECEAQAIADMLAGDDRGDSLWHIVPLYRNPQTCPYVVGRTTLHCSLTPFTLTDAEREAIERSACAWEADSRMGLSDGGLAATLRGLLTRAGGTNG
jgi:hypothetical protein